EVELTIAPVEVPVRSDIEETVAIFIEEAEEHLETIATFLRTEDEKSQDYNALIRAIHTLRGSSSMAQIDQIFEASSKVEHLFKTLLQDEIVSTSKETALLIQYAEFVSDYLHLLRQGNTAKLDAVYATFERVWNNYG
ncbi:Hpt domain-containing protein, partial [Klebsiella pneumoniae]